jgi:hypothetical protein
VKKLLVVTVLSLSAATTAYAGTGSNDSSWFSDFGQYIGSVWGNLFGNHNPPPPGGGRGGSPLAAPEIDPASAGSALTLLGCGLAMVRGRRAKK